MFSYLTGQQSDFFSFLSSSFPAMRLFLSACITFCFPFPFSFFSPRAPLLPPANFHFSLPFFSPSQPRSAAFPLLPGTFLTLSFHLSPPLQCSHLIIPSRNICTSKTTGLLLDHACYLCRAVTTAIAANSCALGVAKGLPCKQLTPGNVTLVLRAQIKRSSRSQSVALHRRT